MSKPRIIVRRTQIIEYTPNPDHYDPGASLEAMAEVDLANAMDDPYLFFDDTLRSLADKIEEKFDATIIHEDGTQREVEI